MNESKDYHEDTEHCHTLDLNLRWWLSPSSGV